MKPSKRQKIEYKVLDYFISIQTEKKGKKTDTNNKGLLDRDFSSVFSYMYPKIGETIKKRDYYQPIDIKKVQELLLEDMKVF